MYRPADWEEQKAAIELALTPLGLGECDELSTAMDMAADAIVKSLFWEGRNVPCGYEEPGHLVFISNKAALSIGLVTGTPSKGDPSSGC